MKKIISILLLLSLCFSFTACGNSAEPKKISCEEIIKSYKDAGYFVDYHSHSEDSAEYYCYIIIYEKEDSTSDLVEITFYNTVEGAKEAAESKRQSEQLSKQVEKLEGRVATGSVIKARGVRLVAYNSSDKPTDRSSRVTYMMVNLSLVENALAAAGPVRVYVKLTAPDGTVLTAGSTTTITIGGETIPCVASREVDYQGAEVDMSIYINKIPEYVKGTYVVEVFSKQGRLGSADVILR